MVLPQRETPELGAGEADYGHVMTTPAWPQGGKQCEPTHGQGER